MRELEHELKVKGSKKRVEEELGDLLFSISQLSRHLGADSERSLRQSSLKFAGRFGKMEKKIKQKGKSVSELSPRELEKEWQLIKRNR